MKKLLVVVILGLSSLAAFTQGTMNFFNLFSSTTFRAPIFGPVPSNPSLSIVGNGTGTLFFPQGTTSYQGASLLSGTGFSLAFFGGPSSVIDPANLTLVTQTTFRTGTAAGFIFSMVNIPVPGVQPGTIAKFQVRVWDNKAGSVTSWAQALLDNSVAKGTSPVVTMTDPLGGTDSNGVLFPLNPDSTGWTSFNVTIVPEPSAFVLAGLGAVSLFLIRRRK